MSKVKKGKRVAAAAMAVALSMATVTTGVLPNTEVHVHAEESDRTWTKLADSSVDGFYYREDQHGNIECVTDKTCVYTSYDQMVKEIASIAKRIFLENKYAKYDFDIPVEIKSDHTIEEIENGKCDKDIRNEIYKDTGKPNEGHTMSAFTVGGGNLLAENCSDGIKYSDGEYKGYYSGSGGYGDRRDRYQEATKKLDEVIKSLNLDGKSDYDKFKAVTNWIVSNVRYDEDNETKYQHDLTGVVLDGLAVCDGYAGTFYYMANAVGLNALFEDGITNSNRIRHAWNLVEIDGTYYYVDPTNAYFKEDGEPGKELLPGQKYLFSLYTPDNTTIEDTYKNISQDDYLKEYSICKGNHDLWESGHNGATCENPATTVYSCKNKGCLYKKYVETAPALGHEWGNAKITQEQSCENPEITTYTCTHSLCGRKKQVETKPALGHTWDEGKVTKEATCFETGVKTYTCTRCGGTKTEEIQKTKHDYEEHVETPATCTSRGVSYYVCKNCGLTTSKKQTPATGHIHTEVRNKKDATYTDDGYTGDTYCKDCGEKLAAGTTTGKKPHTVGTPATCVSKAVCSVCSETFGEVDATNHVHTTVKNRKEATCTQTGYAGDTYCTDCDKLLSTGKELAALGHDYKATVTKQPTTTEEGIRTYTCTKCGHSYTQPIAMIKSDNSNKDNGSQNQKPQSGTDNGNQNQKPQPDTDNGKDNGTSIKPYIKDDSGKEGWDVIKPQLEEAKAGDTVTVVMNGTTVVPKDVIDSIKGKDTTLVLDMGNGLSWKIYGKDITDAAGDIDFDVTVGADAGKSIPVDVINNVTGERSSLNLTLAYDGEFGFTATLTVNMKSKNAGLYANLFYYNEQTGELEFISAEQIDPDGNVELVFTHASDYTIVVDAKIMSDNGQADNKSDETIPAPKTDDSTSKYAWNNTIIIIIGICIILIVFGAVFYVRKKSGSEEE